MRIILCTAVIAACLACLGLAYADSDAGAAAATTDAGPTTVAVPGDMLPELPANGTVEQIVRDARKGAWRAVAVGALALLMGLLNWLGREKFKWFGGDRGGAVLVMLLSMGGALTTALATDVPVDWKLFLGAVLVAWGASGGVKWVRQIVSPADQKTKP
jgi:hypothetical protein